MSNSPSLISLTPAPNQFSLADAAPSSAGPSFSQPATTPSQAVYFSTSLTVAAPAPTLVTTAGSAFKIDLVWDSSVASAPAAFKTDLIAAAHYLETLFSNAATISINVGYGELAGQTLPSGDLGGSDENLVSVGYAALLSALQSHSTDATNAALLASLPATSPVSGMVTITSAEAIALGFNLAGDAAGTIGFGLSSLFAFSDASSVAATKYDFMGTAIHELTEVMGRTLLAGATLGTANANYDLMDLMNYAAAGVRNAADSTAGYLSLNGGASSLGALNTAAGGDGGDWASSVTDDSFDAFSPPGTIGTVSANDITLMNALGWNLGTLAAKVAPTGMTTNVSTKTLTAAQGTGWLNAGAVLANFYPVDRYSWDSFSFALGGASAAKFTLTTTNNQATLAVGSSTLGSPTGAVYHLTLTITDTTLGTHSAALPLTVVVGNVSANSLNLATLLGTTGKGPVFVYGLSGNDSITAAGLSQPVYFLGGAGADTMTGGSGANDYLYSAASDSTPAAMDVITNFNPTTDKIDFTGLGIKLTDVGLITGTTLGVHSTGWLTSGGNTYVVVNTGTTTEKLSAAQIQIELTGTPAITSANIAHL